MKYFERLWFKLLALLFVEVTMTGADQTSNTNFVTLKHIKQYKSLAQVRWVLSILVSLGCSIVYSSHPIMPWFLDSISKNHIDVITEACVHDFNRALCFPSCTRDHAATNYHTEVVYGEPVQKLTVKNDTISSPGS
ncbi:hypothetical protein LX36DRAFT_418287 [Colletotrichum falcatum]|nr:hypothetical protein LX36DRAFT_418287 [Colletotrichum falcatum]